MEGLNSIGISAVGVRVLPNYQPPMISDCVKAASRTPTAIGVPFGIVEQGKYKIKFFLFKEAIFGTLIMK